MRFLLHLPGSHIRIQHERNLLTKIVQIVIAHSASRNLLPILLLLCSLEAGVTQRFQCPSQGIIIQYFLHNSLFFSDYLRISLLFANFPSYLRSIDNHICKSIQIEHSCHGHHRIARIYHIISGVPAPPNDMSCINTEKIPEWYTIPPTQKEKSTSQNSHHRQYVHHKIYENVTWHIFIVRYKHFTWMAGKITYTIRMKTHDDERHILAEPSEEFQYSSRISVAMPHQQVHYFTNIFPLQPVQKIIFIILSHNSLIFRSIYIMIVQRYTFLHKNIHFAQLFRVKLC